MGTFKKIPERFKKTKIWSSYKGKTIIKEVRLFEPSYDEQVRKKEGLWIRHRKRTYLYWFKLLQVTRFLKKRVKTSNYKGWDVDKILEVSFDKWWESHWRDLFATKKKGQEPKFSTSTKKVRYESIRFSYLIGCMDNGIHPIYPIDKQYKDKKYFFPKDRVFTNQQLGYKAVKYELTRRYPTNSNLFYPVDNDYKPIEHFRLDSDMKRSVGQEVSRHKGYFKKYLDNVAKGIFP